MKEKLYLTLSTVFNTVFYTTGKSTKLWCVTQNVSKVAWKKNNISILGYKNTSEVL